MADKKKTGRVPIKAGVSVTVTNSSSAQRQQNGQAQSRSASVGASRNTNDATLPTFSDPSVGSKKLVDLCSSSFVKRSVKRKKPNGDASSSSSYTSGATTTISSQEGAVTQAAPSSSLASASNARTSSSSSSSALSSASPLVRKTHGMHDSAESKAETGEGTAPEFELEGDKIVFKEGTTAAQDAMPEEEEYEEVGDGAHHNATYFSFLRRRKSHRWGLEETRSFYKALRQVGTEFSLMQSLFPGRTRKQLKAKFQKEERAHPELVKRALDVSVPLDTSAYDVQYESLAGTASQATADVSAPLWQAGTVRAGEDLPSIFNCGEDPPHMIIEI